MIKSVLNMYGHCQNLVSFAFYSIDISESTNLINKNKKKYIQSQLIEEGP